MKIYVAGHRGMVGSGIVRALRQKGNCEIISRSHAELDLTNQLAVQSFFQAERPEQVYLAAARVGGIHANSTYPAEFMYTNLMIEANIIDAAFRSGVKNSCFLAQVVFIRGWHPNRFVKMPCLPVRWNRPTNLMRLPRLPASSCVKAIIGNMVKVTALIIAV